MDSMGRFELGFALGVPVGVFLSCVMVAWVVAAATRRHTHVVPVEGCEQCKARLERAGIPWPSGGAAGKHRASDRERPREACLRLRCRRKTAVGRRIRTTSLALWVSI